MKSELKVFLIDDDSDEAELLADACRSVSENISLFPFIDGPQALKSLFEGNIPDLIFLDLNMPGMSGKQVLMKLRASDISKELPVVVYSTTVAKRDIQETKDFGVTTYLQKPDNFEGLKRSVRDILMRFL